MEVSGIYKIYCLDENCKDFYIGATKNIKSRWAVHRSCVNNPNLNMYKYKLYDCIRKNGNLENWNIEILETCELDKLKEIERYYMEDLKPTLNINRTGITNEERREEFKKAYKEPDNHYKLYHKKRYRDNCERIKEYYREKVYCDVCDIHVGRGNFALHRKSKSHQYKLHLPSPNTSDSDETQESQDTSSSE